MTLSFKTQVHRKKTFFVVIILVVIFFCVLRFDEILSIADEDNFKERIGRNNFPGNGRNVLFVETDESSVNVTMTARQACAIESAALANPNMNIYLFYSSAERFQALQKTPILKAVMTYPNVFINYIDVKEVSIGSPFEEFIKSGNMSKSNFKIEHTSDVLRLLVLWKYGGTYLDLDMIVRKSFDSVEPNFACLQNDHEVNGAILNFDMDNGRNLLDNFIQNLVNNFNGYYFIANGPALITRVVKKICQTDNMTEIAEMENCQGFHVFKKTSCYEISWTERMKFLEEQYAVEVIKRLKNSIVVHFWNRLSKTVRLNVNSSAAYIWLAQHYCPKVLDACEEYF